MRRWHNLTQKLNVSRFKGAAATLLVILICLLCWKLAALFWLTVAPPQLLERNPVVLGSNQAALPMINQFSLFEEPALAARNTENLPIELQGVMLARPESRSSAVIKLNDRAERYKIGDQLEQSQYVLSAVYWDHIVLKDVSGATREVAFKGLPNGLNAPEASLNSSTSAQSQPAPATSANNPNAAIGQAIQQMQQDQSGYLAQMGVNATANGYEVTEQTPSQLRNTLGLRAGDRVLSVNGQAIGQGQNEIQLLENIRRQGSVRIEIQRGDQVMTIQQSF